MLPPQFALARLPSLLAKYVSSLGPVDFVLGAALADRRGDVCMVGKDELSGVLHSMGPSTMSLNPDVKRRVRKCILTSCFGTES